jgi:hypothetical protein
MTAAIMFGLAAAIGVFTSRTVARYGASGMAAGMAAMMAAIGTGLAAGYGAGTQWDLGWATLVGVLTGGMHGLVMGRRHGPMAALDGAGGGVMGGLMGPMLAVMLLYLPLSVASTALLMLLLQALFSAGAVYLVAAGANAPAVRRGWLVRLGWVLGAGQGITDVLETDGVPTPMAGAKGPGRRVASTKSKAIRDPGANWGNRLTIAFVVVAVGFGAVVFTGWPVDLLAGTQQGALSAQSFAPDISAVAPTISGDGVQMIAMTLRVGRYEPPLVDLKAATPVRLSMQAIGDPG